MLRTSSDSKVSTIKNRYDGIDMLRGIAILMVVIFHYTARYWEAYSTTSINQPHSFVFPGWLGVDLFFIISGYCISLTVQNIQTVSGFWAARFSRLQPAYMACAALTFITLTLFPLANQSVSVTELIGNFIWLNSIPTLFSHIDGVYWSLIVELKFYFYFGIFWFLHQNPKRILQFFTALVLIGIITQEGGKNLGYPEIAKIINEHLFIYPYSGFFLFGIILFHWNNVRQNEAITYVILAVVTILLSDRHQDVLLYTLALFPISALFIHLKDQFSFKPLVFIGLVSYSWYLLHQMIGYVIMNNLNERGLVTLSPWIAAIVTFGLATAINLIVEHRYRNNFYAFFKTVFVKIGFKK
jgi:peptidoglycan/LPS O-acetylase OafA/YrhL